VLAWPTITAIDELPDGRQLVLLAPRGEVVIGRAQPYPHPVAGCTWLSSRSRPTAGTRARRSTLASRPRSRPIRILPNTRDSIDPATHRSRVAIDRRAEALLESLLRPDQLADWRATRRFWVHTPRGPVQLGNLYALVHHPDDDPRLERILCVVPDRHKDLPIADIWANLLLVLAVEPDAFFRVAIERARRQR